MCGGECVNCGKPGYIEWHHVILRSQAPHMKKININLIQLCQECHRSAPNGVHHNKKLDIKLKKQLQTRLQTIFTNEFYSREEIQTSLECSDTDMDLILKKLSNYVLGYSSEQLLIRLMGGRLYN